MSCSSTFSVDEGAIAATALTPIKKICFISKKSSTMDSDLYSESLNETNLLS